MRYQREFLFETVKEVTRKRLEFRYVNRRILLLLMALLWSFGCNLSGTSADLPTPKIIVTKATVDSATSQPASTLGTRTPSPVPASPTVPPSPTPTQDLSTLADIAIAAAGSMSPIVETFETSLDYFQDSYDFTVGTVNRCPVNLVEAYQTTTQLAASDVPPGTLYPGAVFSGTGMRNGSFNEYGLPRVAGTYTVSGLPTLAQSAATAVPSLSNSNDTLVEILDRLESPAKPNGNLTLYSGVSNSLSEAAVSISVKSGIPIPIIELVFAEIGPNVGLEGTYSTEQSFSYLFLVQEYYTYTYQPQIGMSQGYFDFASTPNIAVDFVDQHPVYVKSAVYGRMVAAVATTSNSELEVGLEAALQASINLGGVAEFDVPLPIRPELSGYYRRVIESSTITINTIGDSAPHTVSADELDSIFNLDAKVSVTNPGRPLYYTLGYLYDGGATLVELGQSLTYNQIDVANCDQSMNELTIEASFVNLCIVEDSDSIGGDGEFTFSFGATYELNQRMFAQQFTELKKESDPNCNAPFEPDTVNNSQPALLVLPNRNGTCFEVSGELVEHDGSGGERALLTKSYCLNFGLLSFGEEIIPWGEQVIPFSNGDKLLAILTFSLTEK
ncbi:MAG: thiol-activated cytolysin family protein [Anaerolineales bacterium]|nr:thiol-activated cytolysin family protein [Anaerolineales bacterium]